MILRRIVAIVAGIVLANLVIFGWEWVLPQLPFGRAVDPVQAMVPGFMATVPFPAKLWVVAGWFLGAFVGALLAFRVSRWDFAGWFVAAFVACAGIANVVTIPHPLWMSICAVVLPFVGAVLAFGVSRRWRAADLHLRR